MIATDPTYLMYIEPVNPPSPEPVNDLITEMAEKVWSRKVEPHWGEHWKGVHTCSCGARSTNCDYTVGKLMGLPVKTNSLLVHYIQYHRAEVPRTELAKLAILAREDS